MEAPEVPLEQAHEDMHHHAKHGTASWTMSVALTSALLAGLAAVASLLAGHHSNEAMIETIKSSDEWNYYQAKGVKLNVLVSKLELLEAFGRNSDPKDKEKITEYKKDQEEISKHAKERTQVSEAHLHLHVVFARGVTMFQVAIAVGAISVLTSRRRFWMVSLAFGVAGLVFMIQGLVTH
jgi:uncharacterized membrane protein YjjB (DUF3815 family)